MKVIMNKAVLKHDPYSIEGAYRLKEFADIRETPLTPDEGLIGLVHSEGHILRVKEACDNREEFAEASLTPESYNASLVAAALAVHAALEEGFALTRPPGHHASNGISKGFCLFNNMAIAAKFLEQRGRRIFVFDFDYHHGDGTERTFYSNKNIFYFSVHAEDEWPYTGSIEQRGEMEGFGYNANLPIPKGAGDDVFRLHLDALRELVDDFSPDLIGISAGFDMHYSDKLGKLRLTEASYFSVGRALQDFSVSVFGVLEGGYHSHLHSCLESFIRGLEGKKSPKDGSTSSKEVHSKFELNIEKLMSYKKNEKQT